MAENRVRPILRCIGSAALLALSPSGAFAAEDAQCVAHVEKVIAEAPVEKIGHAITSDSIRIHLGNSLAHFFRHQAFSDTGRDRILRETP